MEGAAGSSSYSLIRNKDLVIDDRASKLSNFVERIAHWNGKGRVIRVLKDGTIQKPQKDRSSKMWNALKIIGWIFGSVLSLGALTYFTLKVKNSRHEQLNKTILENAQQLPSPVPKEFGFSGAYSTDQIGQSSLTPQSPPPVQKDEGGPSIPADAYEGQVSEPATGHAPAAIDQRESSKDVGEASSRPDSDVGEPIIPPAPPPPAPDAPVQTSVAPPAPPPPSVDGIPSAPSAPPPPGFGVASKPMYTQEEAAASYFPTYATAKVLKSMVQELQGYEAQIQSKKQGVLEEQVQLKNDQKKLQAYQNQLAKLEGHESKGFPVVIQIQLSNEKFEDVSLDKMQLAQLQYAYNEKIGELEDSLAQSEDTILSLKDSLDQHLESFSERFPLLAAMPISELVEELESLGKNIEKSALSPEAASTLDAIADSVQEEQVSSLSSKDTDRVINEYTKGINESLDKISYTKNKIGTSLEELKAMLAALKKAESSQRSKGVAMKKAAKIKSKFKSKPSSSSKEATPETGKLSQQEMMKIAMFKKNMAANLDSVFIQNPSKQED